MDPLQLQLMLKQLRDKTTIGPESEIIYPPDGLGTSVSMPPKHRMPTIGPNPNPSTIAGRMKATAPTIGPAIPRSGLTDGMAVPNELGLDLVAEPFDSNLPEKPAAPAMPMPKPYKPEHLIRLTNTLSDGPIKEAPDNTEAIQSPAAKAAGGIASRQPTANSRELPYQTYERLTGKRWTGGRSKSVQDILSRLGITAVPGSAEANLALQKALKVEDNDSGIQE